VTFQDGERYDDIAEDEMRICPHIVQTDEGSVLSIVDTSKPNSVDSRNLEEPPTQVGFTWSQGSVMLDEQSYCSQTSGEEKSIKSEGISGVTDLHSRL